MSATSYHYPDHYLCARAWPATGCSAVFKTTPDDFVVVESLPFELSGEGEHAWLYIEKRGSNTDWVARQLADSAGVRPQQVSYAGLKDRHAVCRQWFSVHLPGRPDPDWMALRHDEFRVLKALRHGRKLQRGALKSNHFSIRLRAIDGDITALETRCGEISAHGVPNYFGAQRFGMAMANLGQAHAMFTRPGRRMPRHKRSLYLSAARSWLFNLMLEQRVGQACWASRLDGDVFMLQGSQACFADDGSEDIDARLAAGELHPTAALWGAGASMAGGACAALEQAVAGQYPVLAQGLCDAGLRQQRRATRLLPADMSWQVEAGELLLDFTLPSGTYATSLLAELCDLRSAETC